MADALLLTEWTGEAFRPIRGGIAGLKPGERIAFAAHRPRSMQSHNHYFARIADLWGSLPEPLLEMPYAASPDHLRKHALIATGWSNAKAIDCGSLAAANRVAAAVREVHGDYCICQIRERTVTIWTARSQKLAAMGRADFQKSKDDVLGWIEHRIGLRKEAS